MYDAAFLGNKKITIPFRSSNSTHVFHQYTLKVSNGRRDELKNYLNDLGIPSMIYYPIPIHKQKPYKNDQVLENTEILSKEVISLPIHTEVENSNQDYIIESTIKFFK